MSRQKQNEKLDIKKPKVFSPAIGTVEEAIDYLQRDAIRYVGVKGDANRLLETAIYRIRDDLSKKSDISPSLTGAQAAMEKLDGLFRKSVSMGKLPGAKANHQKVRDCIAEITDKKVLEGCYEAEQKVEQRVSQSKSA